MKYCSFCDSIEPTASRPRTEIVGKNEYFCFGMRDFLGIEASFMQTEEELLSSWWNEYVECSEGPKEQPRSKRVGVPVKGGLYEVDLVKRHCFPVYWNGDNRRVLRGHWFARKLGLDWLSREDVAEQLEIAYRSKVWHQRRFQHSGLFAARVDLQGSTPELYALFIGEDDTWESWLNVDASGFYGVISFSGNGIKLRRGYSKSQSKKPSQEELHQQKEEEMDDYCSQVPVKHLVFMVHGIGQRLEKSNLVDDAGNFRHITASLAEQHLTTRQRGTQRVLYIPCQWRKRLKLSCETAVEKITLDGVRGFHVMLSATVHDVLYYMSPIYCQDIINSVSNQLNWLYLKFLKRNPGYDGKVSIYGHSLGSVLSYDILSHQENLSSPFPMDWRYKEQQDTIEESSHTMNNQPSNGGSSADLKEHEEAPAEDFSSLVGTVVSDTATATDEQTTKEDMVINKNELLATEPKQSISEKLEPMLDDEPKSYTPYIKYTKLEFKVDTFFAVGSALGKGQDYMDEENIIEEMLACRQMFNIFHPYDPVAYRVEPLVCKEFLTVRPVIIPYHRGGKRLHIWVPDVAARSQAIVDQFNSVRAKVLIVCQSRNANALEVAENAEEREERSYGVIMMETLTGSAEGRIDHMLQDKTFEHPYLKVIGLHTNYWRDYNTALFILKHLYRDIPADPNSPASSSEGNSKTESASIGWSDQRETAEEELPLTFSNRMMVRNFSL
ncbi:hypothetical protein Pint_07041 [Pistacia integerrima]|uniref:Uncharacterized protein n=1 Tax=Pistacia integerrima TaxID=434235 RepID=A0ACC0XRQ5_9ROSI|nr:hypothetical protein Pint_07041 [Pistacia integerrima]